LNARFIVGAGALASCASLVACSVVLGFEPLRLDPARGSEAGTSIEDGGNGTDATHEDGSVSSDAAAPCTADVQTDPKNCGRCGHDCGGGACQARVCQAVKVAGGLGIPEGIAVDANFIFVAEYDTNRILRFEKATVPSVCSSAPTPSQCIFTEDQANVFKPTAMAADGTNVYWTNTGGGFTHEIRSCPRAGCGGSGAVVVASLQTEAFGHIFGDELLPLELVVKNGRIFWPENESGAIRSALIDGGAQTTYLENGSFAPVAIAVDDANVYFTDDTNQHPTQIQAVPLDGTARDGGAVKVLASTPARPFGLALAMTGTLYWSVLRVNGVGDGLVQSAPKSGLPDAGSPVGALASNQIEPTSVMVDDTNVYWVQAGSGNAATGMVVYCPFTGCPSEGPIVLAKQQNQPRHLAQDENAIYWSNEGLSTAVTYDGEVWKIAKP